MKIITLTIVFLSVINYLPAQGLIKGKVSDTQKNPVGFVNVLLFKENTNTFLKGAVTDLDGNFRIENVKFGKYYIKATMIGFKPHQSSVIEINSINSQASFNFQMEEDAEMLEEVSIVAEKPLFEQKIDRTVINVQSSVTATGGTALEVLQRSPGIDVDNINNSISMMGKNGVIVMLNGKRMRLNGEALIQLLKSMPSDNIEKIELITAPPASFDAEGDAGVINIQTIKKEDEGIQSNASLRTGYGVRPKIGGSFNINYRKNKLSIFADLSGNQDYTQQDFTIFRTNRFQAQTTETKVFSSRPATVGLYRGRAGLEYQLNENTSIGVILSGYYSHWGLDATTDTYINDNIAGNSLSVLKAKETNDWTHWMSNFNITHEFKNKNKLSFDFDYLHYLDNNPTSYLEDITDEAGEIIESKEFTSDKKTPINFYVLKTDYAIKWSEKFNTQIGIKGTFSKFSNDINVSNLIEGAWVKEPRFTDIFTLNEQVRAAYVSTDYIFSDELSAKAGLRYEYYDSDLSSLSEGDLLLQQFGRFFPSLFLTYKMNKDTQLQVSYNQRISRPAFNTIAPAFFFLGYNSILAGNPSVRPTISEKLSVNLRLKELLINFQYAEDQNPLTYQPTIIAEENLLVTKAENMGDRKTATISLNFPIQLTDWWESRYTFSAYWQKLQPIFEDELMERENYYFTANTTQKFTLPKEYSLELTAYIRSKRKIGLGEIPIRGGLNLGLQKKISDKLKMTLNWNDLFNLGSFFEIDYNQPNINMDYVWNYDLEGNIFRFSLSWQLGNNKLKKIGNRKTGSEEERNRVN